MHSNFKWNHPAISRRTAIQAGAIGIVGLGMNHLSGLKQAIATPSNLGFGKAKSCIFIFLSGGLASMRALT